MDDNQPIRANIETASIPAKLPKNVASELSRLKRRRWALAFLRRFTTPLSLLFFISGVIALVILPLPELRKETHISENALLAGQVYTSYRATHHQYALDTERLVSSFQNASIEDRSKYIINEFKKLGLEPYTQRYTSYLSSSPSNPKRGVNVYGVLRAPRSDGTEGLVLSASWWPRWKGKNMFNSHGVLLALSMAKFWKRYSYWAKDLIILITDEEPSGSEAWLQAYHGVYRSRRIHTDPLPAKAGNIQGAVNLNFFTSHHFNALGVSYEGLNGQLPNLDIINSVVFISRLEGLTVSLHGADSLKFDSLNPTPSFLNEWIGDYVPSLQRLMVMMANMAGGVPSGMHGGFKKYNIDAVTLVGLKVPNSYHVHSTQQIGVVLESTFRTLNNLVERFHQSYFLYLLTGVKHFISIMGYIWSVILLCVCMILGSLTLWCDTDAAYSDSTISTLVSSSTFTKPKRSSSGYDLPSSSSFTSSSSNTSPIKNSRAVSKNSKEKIPKPYTSYPRRIALPLAVLISCLGMGGIVFVTPELMEEFNISGQDGTPIATTQLTLSVIFTVVAILRLIPFLRSFNHQLFYSSSSSSNYAPNPVQIYLETSTLKSFILSISSIIILSLSTINFSLSVILSFCVIPVTLLIRPTESKIFKLILTILLIMLSPIGIGLVKIAFEWYGSHMITTLDSDKRSAVTEVVELLNWLWISYKEYGSMGYIIFWLFWVPVNLMSWVLVWGF
ncbi:Gaa1-like protein [Paraphysoderma sedebokerense]|nr:Gaa1-like protein [Paraphysoderma sedebokerense]